MNWDEWGQHILVELKRQDTDLGAIKQSLVDIQVEIAMLKVKSGLWGMVGAAIPITITLGLQLLIK